MKINEIIHRKNISIFVITFKILSLFSKNNFFPKLCLHHGSLNYTLSDRAIKLFQKYSEMYRVHFMHLAANKNHPHEEVDGIIDEWKHDVLRCLGSKDKNLNS